MTVSDGDTASGRVTVHFTTRRRGAVILDFRGLSLGDARVNGAVWRDAPLAWNRHHLTVPASLVRLGRNTVALSFSTPVASAGAAIIRTRDASDSSTYLYALLVPSDAHLLFPSFDQPDLKARLTLQLTTPAAWTALANGALVRRDRGATGVTHVFAPTQPLSTYLMAFAAGPWQRFTRTEVIAPGAAAVPTSLYVRRSRAAEAEADTLLAMNARALRWLGQYFGVPYAFDKYDALLAPAFPFGGMEHPGAVFYNEESFIYRERPTTSQLLGRQATTFHEVAHQWFGDYVTIGIGISIGAGRLSVEDRARSLTARAPTGGRRRACGRVRAPRRPWKAGHPSRRWDDRPRRRSPRGGGASGPSSGDRRRVGGRARGACGAPVRGGPRRWGAPRPTVRLAGAAGPKVGEDLVDHCRLGDERDDPHRAATRRTGERVHLEDLLEEGCPAAAGLGRRQSRRGDDHRRPSRGGERRLLPHAARTVRIMDRTDIVKGTI